MEQPLFQSRAGRLRNRKRCSNQRSAGTACSAAKLPGSSPQPATDPRKTPPQGLNFIAASSLRLGTSSEPITAGRPPRGCCRWPLTAGEASASRWLPVDVPAIASAASNCRRGRFAGRAAARPASSGCSTCRCCCCCCGGGCCCFAVASSVLANAGAGRCSSFLGPANSSSCCCSHTSPCSSRSASLPACEAQGVAQ